MKPCMSKYFVKKTNGAKHFLSKPSIDHFIFPSQAELSKEWESERVIRHSEKEKHEYKEIEKDHIYQYIVCKKR